MNPFGMCAIYPACQVDCSCRQPMEIAMKSIHTLKEITVTHAGRKYDVEVRGPSDIADHRRNTHRAFVWGPGDDLDDEHIHAAARSFGLPNGWTERGQLKTIDKMWDDLNKRVVAAKREVLDAVLRQMGIYAALEVKFSRKAGCSRGCSPGFIITGPILGRRNTTIYIERQKVEHVTEDPSTACATL